MVALPLDGTLTAMEEMQGIRSVEGGGGANGFEPSLFPAS